MRFVNNVANSSVITNNATLALDVPPPWGNVRSLPIKGSGTILKEGNGPLWLQSSAEGSQFDVLAGILGGEGTITAPVTVALGATLSPGYKADYEVNGIGQLSISNTLTLAEGSQTSIEIDRSVGAFDTVVGLTTVNFGGTLTVNNLGGTFLSGDTYKLFSAAHYSGNFSAFSLPSLDGSLSWVWNPNTGTLNVVPVTGTTLVAVQKGTDLELSWPADYTGWQLQVQTNSVTDTNWFVWPGSTATNQVLVPIDPAVGAMYFRMLLPTLP
jgi:hypothetical protein